MIRRFLLVIFFMEVLVCNSLAQEGRPRKGTPLGDETKASEDYSAAEAVKKGRSTILDEKYQLEEKEKTEEEKAARLEEEEEEVRKEIYEQRLIEQAATPQPMTILEMQLQRERLRREMMTLASRAAEVPFKVKREFSLRVSETYDDNIYLAKTDIKKDYITTISPSALFTISSKYAVLDINYVMDVTRYKNNKKDQSGVSHLLATYIRPGTLALPFLGRRRGKIGIEIQEDFQPLVTSVASSEQTGRTERTYNRFFLAADYYMSTKRTLALEYTNIYNSYKSATLQNYSYTHHDISPTFYFHIRPKWSLFTGYDYGIREYSKGTNSSVLQRLRTGLKGTIFTKVLANLEIGPEWRSYEDPKNGTAQELFFKMAFINRFTPSTRGFLTYAHELEESQYGHNPYYITDHIKLGLEHNLTYKTGIILGMGYTRNSYDKKTTEDGVAKNRRDNIWEPTLGLRYNVKKWASTGLVYAYKKRTSNFGKFDYVDNRITGKVDFKF